jgi:hypothetical protein
MVWALAKRESFQAELLVIASNLDTGLREIQLRNDSVRRTDCVLKVLETSEALWMASLMRRGYFCTLKKAVMPAQAGMTIVYESEFRSIRKTRTSRKPFS